MSPFRQFEEPEDAPHILDPAYVAGYLLPSHPDYISSEIWNDVIALSLLPERFWLNPKNVQRAREVDKKKELERLARGLEDWTPEGP